MRCSHSTLITSVTSQSIPIGQLQESPTNPRRTFSTAVTTDFRIRSKLRTMNRWMMTYGASQQEGSAHFRVWAPKIVDMAVKISGRLFPMDRQGEDFDADMPDVETAIDYLFVL